MFTRNREDLIPTLEFMRERCCVYRGPTCDCKYGHNEKSRSHGEDNGCPELRNVITLLKNMTDEEYNEVIARGGHIRHEQVEAALTGKPVYQKPTKKEILEIHQELSADYPTRFEYCERYEDISEGDIEYIIAEDKKYFGGNN